MPRSAPTLALLALLLPACASSPTSTPPPEPTPTVATVTVTPGSADLQIGGTVQLAAQAKEADGTPLTRSMTWGSSAEAIATVSSSGLVTAVAPGTATITATADGKLGSATVTVAERPVASVEVNPTTGTLDIGETLQLTVTLRAAGGQELTGRTVTWSSSDAAVAAVSGSGLVTANAEGGPVTITATSEGQSATAQVTVTAPPVAFTKLATGYYHSCALTASGEAWCWGRNDVAQLGLGSNGSGVATPSKVNTSLRFMAITAGWDFTCGLAMDGKAWCWGDGTEGALGQGALSSSTAPVAVSGDMVFSSLHTGDAHVCGVSNQQGYCWGLNDDGYLGNGTTTMSSTPVLVSGSHAWQRIETGALHTCGLDTAGAAWCWGFADDGELGNGGSSESDVPVAVSGGHVFVQLSVGDWHACGRTADGALWCWGWNQYGQIGDGSNINANVPVQVSGGDQFADVSAAGWATCGRLVSGLVKCWGNNEDGELGDGSLSNSSTPVALSGNHMFTSISHGLGYHHCGIRADDGRTLCWGWNEYGQLGVGSYTTATAPMAIPEFTGLRAALQAVAPARPATGHRRPRHGR